MLSWSNTAQSRTYFIVACGYVGLAAGLEMWMVLTEPYGTSAGGEDIVACVTLGCMAIAFPIIHITEVEPSEMSWRVALPTGDIHPSEVVCKPGEPGVNRRHILVRFPMSGHLIAAWMACQLYVSMKFFLDPVRLFADVLLVGVIPLAMSVFLEGDASLAYWLHLRILCENARWLVFCFFPAVATRSFNAAASPIFFSYSSWIDAGTSDAQLATLYVFSVFAATYTALMYFFPTRGGVSRCRRKAMAPLPIKASAGIRPSARMRYVEDDEESVWGLRRR